MWTSGNGTHRELEAPDRRSAAAALDAPTALLEVKDLTTRFATPEGEVAAVTDLSFRIDQGESVGVVGESGSGKTQTFLSIMGLLARNGRCIGTARFHGRELLHLPARELNRIRGVRLAMIFQDPMTSLNPYLRISRQMTEVLVEHKGMSEADARSESLRLLDQVGLPAARARFDRYPPSSRGGMRQRVMIAIALLCQPDLLVADEPTTAVDVTVQAQILDLLQRLRRELGMGIVLITHDLGGRRAVRSRDGDVRRADRRDGADRADVRRSAAPVHEGAVELDAAARRRRGGRSQDHSRAAAEPPGVAGRLRLSRPLRLCVRTLRRAAAAARLRP
jgi:ABC-type microcin C transport system duplicated ATPase subunit YejF